MDYPRGNAKEKSSSWADLPPDILKRIHAQLYFTDQIRLRAVCRNWSASSSDKVVSNHPHYTFPWILNHGTMWSTGHDVYPFPSKLFDPYSNSVHKLSSFSRSKRYPTDCYDHTTVYASKFNGWILVSHQRDTLLLPRTTCLFLRNVFTNHVIFLPELDLDCVSGTFTADPITSPQCCTVLVVGNPLCGHQFRSGLHVAFYCLASSKDETWTTKFIIHERNREYPTPGFEKQEKGLSSVLYINRRFYCLDHGGDLRSYNLLYGSSNYLAGPINDELGKSPCCWLFEDDEKGFVMIGRFFFTNEWSIWKPDWSQETWVAETDLKHTAYFISDKVSFSAPLVDGEELNDCRVYYVSEGSIKCYSLYQRRHIQPHFYSWVGKLEDGKICFIQPPWLNLKAGCSHFG